MESRFELELSAMVDGELSHGELLGVVDRLLDSPQLSELYRRMRRLDGALASGGMAAAAGELPPGLWERIERAAAEHGTGQVVETRVVRLRRMPRWAMAAAAAVVLALGGWIGGRSLATGSAGADRVLTVELGAEAGRMSDQRFIELTAELLRADPRHQQAIGRIILAVNDSRYASEGVGEGMEPLRDRGHELRFTTMETAVDRDDRSRLWN